MSPPSSRRRLRALGAVATGVLTLIVVLVGLLQLAPVATWLVRRALPLVPLNPGYRLEVGRASGNPFGGLNLEAVRLRRAGRELAWIGTVRTRYDLRRLRGAVTHLDQLSIEGARIVARREGGRWDLANAIRRSPDSTGKGGGLAVDRLTLREVQLEAWVAPDSAVRARDLSLNGRDLLIGHPMRLTLDQLNVGLAPPGSGRWFALATHGALTSDELRLDPLRLQTERSSLVGRVVLPMGMETPALVNRLDLRLRADPLAMEDLAAVVPSAPPEGELRLAASARGQGGMIISRLAARLDDASIDLTGTTRLDRGKPAGVRLHAAARRVDPSRLHRGAPLGEVNGTVDADVRGPILAKGDGSVELRLGRSRLGNTRVEGFRMLSNLVGGRADVWVRGRIGTGTLALSGKVRPFDSLPEYRLSGSAGHLPGTDPVARRLAGPDGEPILDVRFSLAGAGLSPRSARASGRLDLDALRRTGERVPLGHATVSLGNSRLEARPTLLLGGGRVSAVAVAWLGDTLTYEVRDGVIDRVDLGRISRDTVTAPLSGHFSFRGRGASPATSAVVAHVELDDLRYGARRIDSVTGDVRLDRGDARMMLHGALQGGRFALDAAGRPFDSAAVLTIRRGSLERVDLGTFFGRPAYAGPVTLDAAATGRWGAASPAVNGRVVLRPSTLGPIQVQAGSITAVLAGRLLRYGAVLRTNGGSLSLEGDGRPHAPAPAYSIRQGRAEALDLGVLLGRPGLRTGLNADFSASLSDTGSARVANVALRLLPSTINQAQLRSGELKLGLEGEALRGDLRLDGPDGEVSANLTGHLARERGELRSDGTLRLERLARWTGREDAGGRLEARYSLDAATDSAGLLAVGGRVSAVGGVGDARIHELQLVLRPDTGAVRVDTLLLRSNVAVLEGAGAVALRRRAGSDTLRVRGRLGDLAPIAGLAGADTVSLDSARVALAVTGPAWRWQVASDADLYRLLYAGNLAEHLTLHATTTLDSARISAAAGTLAVQDAAWGRLSIPKAQLAGRYDSLLALEARVAVGDSIHLDAALRGRRLGDTLRTVLQRFDLAEGGRTWSLERPADLTLGPRVSVGGLALSTENGRARILVDGVFDRHGPSDMQLRLAGFDLDPFRSAGLAPIGGRLDGFLHLTGTPAEAALEGKVALTIRQRGGKTAGSLVTALDWQRTGLRIDAAAASVTGGWLYLNGTLPWRFTLAPADTAASVGMERASGDSLDLLVRSDSFNLALFEPLLPPDAAKGLQGKLQVDTRIGGTPEAPTANGSLHLIGARMSLPSLGVDYDHGELVGHLAGDQLRIERLRLTTGKHHEIVAQGTVRLRPLTEPGLDLAARLHDFRISHSSTLQTSASGQLKLGGTALEPTLTGALTLGRSDVFVGNEAAAIKVKPVELTPEDYRKLARDFGPAVLARVHESPGLVSRFRLDLDLRLPERVWIRKRSSPSMDIELAGRMRLRQEPGQEMQFFGRVEPVPGRGVIGLSGRQFHLTGGEITLTGPTDSTKLDVTAEYQVPTQGGGEDNGVLITVAAKGRLDSLGLTFSADPEMSQDDIFSYIVTGRPASDNPLLAKQAGSGNAGEEIAMGQLTTAISNTAGQNLGLDVFQIRQDPSHGLTLTAGRYLSSQLFLNLQLPLQLGSRAQPNPGANLGPGFELEYALRRWLRADVRGGSLPPGFSFRGRRAY